MKFKKKRLFFLLTPLILSFLIVFGLTTGTLAPKDSTLAIFTKREIARGIYHILSIHDPWENKKKTKAYSSVNINLNGYTSAKYKLLNILKGYKIKVLEYNNPQLKKSSFIFEYQHFDNDKLRRLREKYLLNRIFIKTDTDFEGFIKLRDWVKSRWKHGYTLKEKVRFNNFDSLKILNLAERGEKFVCGEYSYTYVQCVAAVGGIARVVSVGSRDNREFHVVSEVWSNLWGKWIMMDVDQDMHYEKNGTPQNTLELHNALVYNKINKIEIVKGIHYSPYPHTIRSPTKGVELYYNIAVRMRNNFFMEYPKWHRRGNLFIDSLEWVDGFTKDRFEIILATNKINDLYWDLNKTSILFKKAENSKGRLILDILLNTFTPNFRNFMININGKSYEQESPVFQWELQDKINSLEVFSVNEFGIKGRHSKIIMSK